MKRAAGILAPILFAVFAAVFSGLGCGGGSGNAEVNTRQIDPIKPGETVDLREVMKQEILKKPK